MDSERDGFLLPLREGLRDDAAQSDARDPSLDMLSSAPSAPRSSIDMHESSPGGSAGGSSRHEPHLRRSREWKSHSDADRESVLRTMPELLAGECTALMMGLACGRFPPTSRGAGERPPNSIVYAWGGCVRLS